MSEDAGRKLALVTGASRGIGAATAEALAAAGYHIVLSARTAAGLEEVEERIHASGGSATIAPLDLTDGESIGRLAGAIAQRWQALDVLVLNAAMLGSLGPVPHIDPREFAKIVTLNLTAQAAMIAAFDGMLRAAPAPRLIGLTTSVARAPRAYWGAYGASKAGFETLLGAYAEENRNVGRIRVAILDPGATRTAMRARAYPGEDPAKLKSPEVVAARIVALATEDFETGSTERL
ncbi:MAG: SDR family NAD(P)-dependent oxidoreductase [Sphingomonadaceae bacterium]|nr:SDR family NAD(P)-dependent oxidoreductase [Sphingomonadaceae bacterium]